MARLLFFFAIVATLYIVSVEACHQGTIAALMRQAASIRRSNAARRAACAAKRAQANALNAQANRFRGMYNTLYNRYKKAQNAKNMQKSLAAEYNRLIAAKTKYLACLKSTAARRRAAYSRNGAAEKARAAKMKAQKEAQEKLARQRDIARSKALRAQEQAERERKLREKQQQQNIDANLPNWIDSAKGDEDVVGWLKEEPSTQQQADNDLSALFSKNNWWEKRSLHTFVKRDTIGIARAAVRSARAAQAAVSRYCAGANTASAQANLNNWRNKYNAYRKKVGAPDVAKWLALHKRWNDKTSAERKHKWEDKAKKCAAYASNMPKSKTVPVGGSCLFTFDCKRAGSFCSANGNAIGICKQKCMFPNPTYNKHGHCMDAPPGHKCLVNRQCRSYFCKAGKCAKSMIGIDVLARCKVTSDCMKGAFCYRHKSRRGAKYGHCQQVCQFTQHQRGATALRVGGFCHNAPGGHPCMIDSQCWSKKCRSNHTCYYQQNAPTGHPCLSHGMCRSGVCSVVGAIRKCM